ncbi:hypothetical protein QTO34_010922 [Cnephaeus nilssonii]|uniref:Activator of basal transcription 1 n=1 Tax=Cnephaeus nilssonii TaxID=3371016 RepID=A0AA40HCJ7_CNENI|nr:hypothetical protein QTO34_010922 [Eptesicus nilssonii]
MAPRPGHRNDDRKRYRNFRRTRPHRADSLPEAEEEQEEAEEAAGSAKKRVVPGIVYLGHIPPRFRPLHVRNLLSAYGEVGRVFFQPEGKCAGPRSGGWVRRVCGIRRGRVQQGLHRGLGGVPGQASSQAVAASLHNTPMGARRRSPFRYDLWNLKYLHRFTWSHLSEHLAFERQVRRQRLRAEVAQAKRETDFYLRTVEQGKNFLPACGLKSKGRGGILWTQRPGENEQRKIRVRGGGGRAQSQLMAVLDSGRMNDFILAHPFNKEPPGQPKKFEDQQ